MKTPERWVSFFMAAWVSCLTPARPGRRWMHPGQHHGKGRVDAGGPARPGTRPGPGGSRGGTTSSAGQRPLQGGGADGERRRRRARPPRKPWRTRKRPPATAATPCSDAAATSTPRRRAGREAQQVGQQAEQEDHDRRRHRGSGGTATRRTRRPERHAGLPARPDRAGRAERRRSASAAARCMAAGRNAAGQPASSRRPEALPRADARESVIAWNCGHPWLTCLRFVQLGGLGFRASCRPCQAVVEQADHLEPVQSGGGVDLGDVVGAVAHGADR